MLKLSNSKKILNEFKKYEKSIEKIMYPEAKKRAIELLYKLKSEIYIIDESHNARNSKSIDPRTVRDNIKRTVDYRTELDRIIKDSK
jgi:hypothetical protein